MKGFFAEPENMSGILNWMLEGYKLFRSQGLEMPDSVVQATMDYQMFSDKMGQFFSECLQPKADSELRRAAVYTRYKEWCAENGYRADSAKALNAEIDKRYTVQKKASGGWCRQYDTDRFGRGVLPLRNHKRRLQCSAGVI